MARLISMRHALLLSEYPTGSQDVDRRSWFSSNCCIHDMPETTTTATGKGNRSHVDGIAVLVVSYSALQKVLRITVPLLTRLWLETIRCIGNGFSQSSWKLYKTENSMNVVRCRLHEELFGDEQGSRALLIRDASTDQRKMFHNADSHLIIVTIISPWSWTARTTALCGHHGAIDEAVSDPAWRNSRQRRWPLVSLSRVPCTTLC
jgi:hypothetical protein